MELASLPCFGHGQLVVALSRVGHPDHVHIFLHPTQMVDCRTQSVLLRGALLSAQDVVRAAEAEDEAGDRAT